MQEITLLETSEPRLLPVYGPSRNEGSGINLRTVVAAAFRHRRLALTSFLAVLTGAVLVVALMPASYQASMKILVRNERVDPAVTPGVTSAAGAAPGITMEDLNSEVELLMSEDVLRSVALKTGFIPKKSRLPWRPQTDEQRLSAAVYMLRRSLDAGPMPRSNLLEVKFASTNPELAANVLNTLADFYIQKHLEVHRTAGQYDFFNQQAEKYRKEMLDAEAEITASGSVAPQLSRDITVQKQQEFEATLQQTRSALAENENRLKVLQEQQASTPMRMTTTTRKSDNPALLQNLKTTLLTLELKRTELLTKYQPTYRPVQEVEKEIADTQASIKAEETAPVRDETTDQDPVYMWERSQIAEAKSNEIALQSRAIAIEKTIGSYHQNAAELDKQSIKQQDLVRAAKTAEDNYLLYVRKSEEARIADALDRRRMLNIAVAESAYVPAAPVTPMSLRLAMSIGLALIISIGLVTMAEYLDPTFRTPAEVANLLAVPVLASLPANSDSGELARL